MPEESRFYRRLETWGGKKKKNGSGANAMRSVHPRWWRERGGSPKGASEIFVSPQFVPSSSQAVLSNFRINSLERDENPRFNHPFSFRDLTPRKLAWLKTKEEKAKTKKKLKFNQISNRGERDVRIESWNENETQRSRSSVRSNGVKRLSPTRIASLEWQTSPHSSSSQLPTEHRRHYHTLPVARCRINSPR